MACPVVKAIAEIRGGGFEKPLGTAIIGGGERELAGGVSSARAASLKLGLARAELTGKPYNGDLLRFAGKLRDYAMCYLLDADNSPLAIMLDELEEATGRRCNRGYCVLYPELLCEYLNDVIAEHQLGDMVTAPNIARPRGDFPTDQSAAMLKRIADDIMQISTIASNIEKFHLEMCEKIGDLLDKLK